MKNIFNKRGNLSSISTIISLSLVLFVVGILALVLINTKKISNLIKEEGILFTIMLNDSTDNTSKEMLSNQRAEFENYLDGSDYFLDFKLIVLTAYIVIFPKSKIILNSFHNLPQIPGELKEFFK